MSCVEKGYGTLKGGKMKRKGINAFVISWASGGREQSLKGKFISPKGLKQSSEIKWNHTRRNGVNVCAALTCKQAAILHSRWWAYKVVIWGFLFKLLIMTPVGLLCKYSPLQLQAPVSSLPVRHPVQKQVFVSAEDKLTANYSHFPAAACGANVQKLTATLEAMKYSTFLPGGKIGNKRCKHKSLNGQDVICLTSILLSCSGCFHFKQLTMKASRKRYMLCCAEAKKSTLLLFISMQMRGKCIHVLPRRSLICIHILICIFPNDLSSSTPSTSLCRCLFYHRGLTANLLFPHFILFKK